MRLRAAPAVRQGKIGEGIARSLGCNVGIRLGDRIQRWLGEDILDGILACIPVPLDARVATTRKESGAGNELAHPEPYS